MKKSGIIVTVGKISACAAVVAGLVGVGVALRKIENNTSSRENELPRLKEAVIRTEEAVKPIPDMAKDIQAIKESVAVITAVYQIEGRQLAANFNNEKETPQ